MKPKEKWINNIKENWNCSCLEIKLTETARLVKKETSGGML